MRTALNSLIEFLYIEFSKHFYFSDLNRISVEILIYCSQFQNITDFSAHRSARTTLATSTTSSRLDIYLGLNKYDNFISDEINLATSPRTIKIYSVRGKVGQKADDHLYLSSREF
jgi:hypothetical protein